MLWWIEGGGTLKKKLKNKKNLSTAATQQNHVISHIRACLTGAQLLGRRYCHNPTHPAMDHPMCPHTNQTLHTQFQHLMIIPNQHLAILCTTHNSDECHTLHCHLANVGEPWEMSGVSLGLAKWSPGELVKVPQ